MSKLFKKNKNLTDVFTLLSGGGIAQVIPFLITPILSRLYTPEEFGDLALYANIVSILVIISTGQFEDAILLPKKNSSSAYITLGAIMICVTFSAFLLVLSVFTHLLFHDHPNLNGYEYWLYLLPLSVLFYGVFNILTLYNNRYLQYKKITYSKVWKSIATSTLKTVFGILNLSSIGLILGNVSGNAFSSLYLIFKSFKGKEYQYKMFSFSKSWSGLKKYSSFTKFDLPRALISSISGSLPVFIFFSHFGDDVTGQYSMAIALSFIPIHVLREALYQTYFQKIITLYNKKIPIYGNVFNITKWVALFLIVPFILIAIFSSELIEIVLGVGWDKAGEILPYLLPWLFMVAVSTSIAFVPKIAGRLKTELYIEVIHMLLRVMSLYLGVLIGEVVCSVMFFSCVGVIILTYNLFWYAKLCKKLDKKSQGTN